MNKRSQLSFAALILLIENFQLVYEVLKARQVSLSEIQQQLSLLTVVILTDGNPPYHRGHDCLLRATNQPHYNHFHAKYYVILDKWQMLLVVDIIEGAYTITYI